MLFEYLFDHAKKIPDDICVVDDQGQYTFAQVAAMAAGMGHYLAAQTSRPRIGILLPAGVGYVASFYGTLLAGKQIVPINFLLGEKEIAHVIADSEIDTVITIGPLAARLKNAPLKIIDLMQLPKTPAAIAPRFPAVGADDPAVLMYTSGSSGLPKGVILSYGNLQSDVDASIEHTALQHGHRFLGVIPLFHAFGMTAMMLAPVQLGSMVVYIARFSPAAALNAIRQHKVSIMFGVPSMFNAMLRLKGATAADFAHFYSLMSGGEPLPLKVRAEFENRFGVTIHEGYGLTESSPVVALNTPQVHRAGSVGKPLPGMQMRIIDDHGHDLPAGSEGEIWFKGPMVMKGYLNLPNETAAALTADGFFKTGDLGHFDADGFLHITGRKKDLIIVAGEKVVPREVEETLLLHPEVADAAVVGKKDASRGEMVVAFVIPNPGCQPTPESLREFCRQQPLAPFKAPREVYIVSEFPRSATGKVIKRVLAEKANT